MSQTVPPSARLVTGAGAAMLAAAAAVLWKRMAPGDPGRGTPETDEDDAARGGAVAAVLAGWVPTRPATGAGRMAAYLWASPLTAVGTVLGLASGGRPRRVDGAVLFAGAGGLLGALLRRRGFSGTTLGHAIITTVHEPPPDLLAHELVHTRQAERLGLAFGPVYVALLARHGYHRHPMEQAARRGVG